MDAVSRLIDWQGDENREPDWEVVKMPAHDSFHRYIGELNHLYLRKKAVWQLDHAFTGFKWVDCCCDNKCVFGYTRTDGEQILQALLHFSDQEAAVSTEIDGKMTLLLNTDWERFGGKTAESVKPSIPSMLPPFTGILFECQASGTFESMKKP